MEEVLNKIFQKLDNMELEMTTIKDDLKNFATKDDLKNFATKDDLKLIHKKLDVISAQTARNAEQESRVDDLTKRVDVIEADVRIIKKAIAH